MRWLLGHDRPLGTDHGSEVHDVAATYRADERPAPPGRPWVALDMITSVDGATAVDDHSKLLGSPGDRAVFSALRALADVVLVGAGTLRDENYGPPRVDADTRTARLAAGQHGVPTLAVMSNRLALDPQARVFEGGHRPVVLAPRDAPARARAALDAVADVVEAGNTVVEPRLALAALHDRGAQVVVCEGGPTLNAALFADDLVDEICLSLSPLVVGGTAARLAGTLAPMQRRFRLARVLEEDSMLFLRYVREPDADEGPDPS
jgi:riboflavin biosynthesis pyrimidine reductase